MVRSDNDHAGSSDPAKMHFRERFRTTPLATIMFVAVLFQDFHDSIAPIHFLPFMSSHAPTPAATKPQFGKPLMSVDSFSQFMSPVVLELALVPGGP